MAKMIRTSKMDQNHYQEERIKHMGMLKKRKDL